MIAQALAEINSQLPADVRLVAVSKFHPAEAITEAYAAGQRCFGESRVQEILEKQKTLPEDIVWHFIGHLQTNKVKQIVGHADMIESVDSPRLLALINKESLAKDVVTNVLLQVHVAREETKFGFFPEELAQYLESGEWREMKNIRICGVMGMASNTDDEDRINADFAAIRKTFEDIKTAYGNDLPDFKEVSMGMSHDWKLAVRHGSTLVRIGSFIFGERDYSKK
jgi:hypothetical protein